ncbi:UDP-3-O-acyl-N-acetylglucosamine deacetylase [Caulobacter mirabilis]|uniref:UDP-3-O-acyl-N-acetylglucosamine deacetylase n=1 Tax=Caulobacter mirabilis TaxID=69666 RepID=A0A2D2B0K7_9CAUL|nr:UDP-3-O-acyl-N-acetylglucosamine deacetylase [Caulobacter mirabilis]ATQ43790.1 UDP-3-O-[3-hydroxymyristoyl] N-acetylglucosamine deacetylase [Caulobacter mirabilis]
MSMSAYYQHTVAGPVIFAGIGVHTGAHVRVAVRPAAPDSGIVFVRADLKDIDNVIRLSAECVGQTRLGTVVSNAAGAKVSTIEHLMAALCALGVDNAVVELDGPEVPILDGSAEPFVQVLDRAGRRRQEALRRYIEVLAPIEVIDGDKRAALLPSDRFEMAFEIFFDSAPVGRQAIDLEITEESFRRELANCRTFGFLKDVEGLRAAGLARGASMENAVVLDGDRVLNPEGLRRPDEFVRHKALDAVGDLYVLGAPLLARFEGRYAGHGLNNQVARALAANPRAWRLRTLAPELAEAV